MFDDNSELIAEFLTESEEHLQVLNDKMLEAETAVKENGSLSTDDMNTMFRAAHTIKGTASFIGLNTIVELTHKSETLLQQLRDGMMQLNQEIVDALFSAIDTLTELLKNLKDGKDEVVDIEEDVNRIEAILTGESSVPNDGAAASGEKPVDAGVAEKSEQTPAEKLPDEVPAEQLIKAEPAGNAVHEEPDHEILTKYLDQFVDEAIQNVADLNELLVSVENDTGNIELINNIFRLMHTLKGSAGIVNAVSISEVAHRMENILDLIRNQKAKLSSDLVTVFFSGMDEINSMLASLKSEGKITVSPKDIKDKLDQCFKELSEGPIPEKETAPATAPVVTPNAKLDIQLLNNQQKQILSDAVSQGLSAHEIYITIGNKVEIKSMKLMLVEEHLKKIGKIIVIQPGFDQVDAAEGASEVGIIFATDKDQTIIHSQISIEGVEIKTISAIQLDAAKPVNAEVPQTSQSEQTKKGAAMQTPTEEVANASAAAKKSAPLELSTIRIDTKKLDNLMNLSGELVIIRAQFAMLGSYLDSGLVQQKEYTMIADRLSNSFEDLGKEMTGCLKNVSGEGRSEANRVMKIIDDINHDLQILNDKIAKSTIVENIHALDETTNRLEKISSDIQSGVMQTRMIPIEGVFSKFKRIVRDISKEVKKEVNLKIEGADTELDKKIVDGLGDPLTHMVRNAVDHGIEDPETRRAAGKTEVGTLLLKASHQGNNICIEISDDGKGLDPEKLVASALKKGLINQEKAERLSEKDKLNLIFMAGFSTAAQVTDLSGRGVGMDVVRNMINSFNGVVDIESTLGQGTRFLMKIPLTLAIINALLVVIGKEIYALPLESVVEIIKVSHDEVYSIDGNETVKLREHALSLIELEKVIKINGTQDRQENQSSRKVVIVTDGESQLGVIVDDLIGKDEIVIKSFTEHFANVRGLTGASILADGRVALILDPTTIIRESR
ncbi:MAG: chemotaxis protein CheA [Candidatus Omnitrophica bacterium]|nr:chemotaxis protein CheA [Candidatus Omnitrophota bacterium]